MADYVGANAPYYATPIEAGCVDDLPTITSGSLIDADDEVLRNRIRAEHTIPALKRYAQTVGGGNSEPIHTMIGDLLSDLRHLCDALGKTGSLELDFDELEAQSYRRYREEINGEP